MRTKRGKLSAAVVGLGVLGATVLATGSANSHGYISTPPSRQALCAAGTVTDCGDIQWEPQSVEGPKGFPLAGPSDGTICSGGNDRFAELDDPRGGDWPATHLTGGQSYDFTWTLTARHATTDFKYYITNSSYDPTRPLTRSELEPEPFLTIPYNGAQPPSTVVHNATIPSGHTGKQLILGVWTIADTGNAFYACADVQF
ncbi:MULTISPECIES: lytic polysaccharide monooxygenase auxiliary activity family 9 protein [Streptomycetaceae]|uniref:Putative secreted chitin-binding protein n=1 Tax=Streptantibioticus cattleyicolor (strain ATCC 35852 / DSM 46488 / JCM 4925 / NBRC 14057 / NRRL 8057) TaxID=1003195 RepID=F8JTB3_STREN|nr:MULTISPECIES: lytic polysaccharide monooxygenase auxiliary activity family 9 protein [Streptomycetaceae]AEW94262.1 putative secreted chitin-binding protein [Streptantibioticus cattleyicolor NRRL 8057 = DSM 46488]MYS58918.1 chitin-binding protein [Streptomyces sp. SID5468]CCB74617.1 Chitin-binding protein [Streptantibioticus cattleyicolor NRRL 8057 = DSM 46488]